MALSDNLISFWALNEASGTRADKVTASANTLTDNNTVTQAVGKVYANAGQFTSANSEYLSITDNASLSVGGTAFTIILWVYLDTIKDAGLISKDDGVVNREFCIYILAGSSNYFITTWTAASDVGQLQLQATNFGVAPTSTWTFLMAKSDQTTNYISVNDGTPNTVSAVNAGWNGAAPFEIGRFAANSTLTQNGRIGPVMFWKRALPASDITKVYKAGAGMTYEEMIQNFPLKTSLQAVTQSANW